MTAKSKWRMKRPKHKPAHTTPTPLKKQGDHKHFKQTIGSLIASMKQQCGLNWIQYSLHIEELRYVSHTDFNFEGRLVKHLGQTFLLILHAAMTIDFESYLGMPQVKITRNIQTPPSGVLSINNK
eukprot:jgi/Psemu1/11241/gm1.11241_g